MEEGQMAEGEGGTRREVLGAYTSPLGMTKSIAVFWSYSSLTDDETGSEGSCGHVTCWGSLDVEQQRWDSDPVLPLTHSSLGPCGGAGVSGHQGTG